MQKFDSLLEVKLKHWVSALELLEWILLINHTELLSMPCLDSFEHKDHKFTNQIQNFKVMILKLHFKIETCELAQMTVSVRILSTEDWTNLKNSLEVSAEGHLLV